MKRSDTILFISGLMCFQRKTLLSQLTLLLFFFQVILQAQSTYLRTIGGANSDFPSVLVESHDHGFAWIGTTWSYGNSMWVGKTSPDATHDWSRIIGGTGHDRGKTLSKTADGGFIIGGNTTSFSARLGDCFVAKCDAAGEVEWARMIGGAGADNLESIIQTEDGGYAFGGSTTSFGVDGSLTDLYFVKLDARGGIEWSFTYYDIGDEWASSVIQTSDEGYLIAGNIRRVYFLGYLPFPESPYPTHGNLSPPIPVHWEEEFSDILLIKLDRHGNMEWVKMQTTDIIEAATSLIETSDGKYAVCGYTYAYGAGSSDIYILKLDGDGTLLWTKTIGGTRGEAGYSMIETTDHGLAICGYTNSFGHGNDDIYVVKLKTDGRLQWSTTIGGPEMDQGKSIVQSDDGGFTVAGFTNSFGGGLTDILIARLSPDGSICDHSTYPVSLEGSGGILSSINLQKNTPRTVVRKVRPGISKAPNDGNMICTE